MQRIIFPLLVIFITLACQHQPQQAVETNVDATSFVVAYYNVENLFDTIDDTRFWDEEFTPNGKKHWDSKRYHTKLDRIAEVLSHIDTQDLPWLIGLEEVENRAVLEDLIQTKALARGKYAIIHQDSPDFRGIDNAILYRRDKVKLLHEEIIPVTMPFDIAMAGNKLITTRDIVYARFLVAEADTLHMFVNHWTSMYYGETETMPHRAFCGRVLRKHIQPILNSNSKANIVMGGDFNEYVAKPGIVDNLQTDTIYSSIVNNHIYNMAHYAKRYRQERGSYHYKGYWGFLDHILINGAMLNGESSLQTTWDAMRVFDSEMVLNYYNNKYGKGSRPNRSYVRDDYKGGYSDHLPIYVRLHLK